MIPSPYASGSYCCNSIRADALVGEANAEADLARAVRQVRSLFAQAKELRAQIKQARNRRSKPRTMT